MNILFTDEEIVLVTIDKTLIYYLPIQTKSFVPEIETFENELGLCATAWNVPSHFIFLGQSKGEILFNQAEISP